MNTPIDKYFEENYRTTLYWRSLIDDPYAELRRMANALFIDPARPEGVSGTATAFNSKPANPLLDQAGKVGKNLFDLMRLEQGTFDATGTLIPQVSRVRVVNLKISQVGHFLRTYSSFCKIRAIAYYNASGGYISQSENGVYNELNLSPPQGASYVNIAFTRPDLSTPLTPQQCYNEQIQLELGSVATACEPYGKANVLMNNMAWTNLDGYRVETINGKTNVFINLDGTDSFGALNSASAPNPTGSDDFWQLWVGRPDAVGGYYGVTRNNNDFSSLQYGLLVNATSPFPTQVVINGVGASANTAYLSSLQYILYGRLNGRLFTNVNGVETNDVALSQSILTRQNTQLGCRSASTDGLTKSALAKGLQGLCAMEVRPQGTIDKAKVYAVVSKLMKQMYGLGV